MTKSIELRDGTTVDDYRLGRLPSTNATRLELFAAASIISFELPLTTKLHRAGPLLDQYPEAGYDGSGCVGFSGANVLRTSPVRTKQYQQVDIGRQFAIRAYNHCKEVDEYPGEGLGTSLDAFGKVMLSWQVIDAYHWVTNGEPELAQVLMGTPAQMGTWWTTGMDAADDDPNAVAKFTGKKRGGHAWMVNGYYPRLKLGNSIDAYYRGVQTWGPWGLNKHGYFFVPQGAMSELLADDGEAMIMVEKQ